MARASVALSTGQAALRFGPEALAFLRALKRHNDRDWFRERRDIYETRLRAPMLAIIERLARDFAGFAPELLASPKTSFYRIYRDTRFTEDKSPFKTHVAAVFPHRDLDKHEGAGLYFHVSPNEVFVGGGMYAPPTPSLHAVREHVAANVRRFRAIVESPAFRRAFGGVQGERLQRVPRGFPPDHLAADYLRFRQFLAAREHPASFASSTRFYGELVRTFRLLAPFIRFLNEPLVGGASRSGSTRRLTPAPV